MVKRVEPRSMREKARFFLSKGNAYLALPLFKDLLESGDKEVSGDYEACLDLMRRRYLKKGETYKFLELSKNEPKLSMALAKIKGEVESLAKTSDISALLAKSLVCDDLKKSLLLLRRDEKYAKSAEGWLALQKGDAKRALLLFSEIEEKQPNRCKVGKGVAYAVQKNFLLAKKHLKETSKKIAAVLPVTNFLLEESMASSSISYQLLYEGSLSTLIAFYEKSKSVQNPLKPWILLRIGDLYFREGDKKNAKKFWERVERKHPSLRLDVYKREMHLELEKNNFSNASEYALKIYHALDEKSSKEAKRFIETLAFDPKSKSIISEIKTVGYDKNEHVWLSNNPLSEWLLVELKKTISFIKLEQFNPFARMGGYWKEGEQIDPIASFSKWGKWLSILDKAYGDREPYFRDRYYITSFFKTKKEYLKSMFLLMQNNPMNHKEFMDQYVELAIEKNSYKKELATQCLILQKVIPTHYQLARLFYFVKEDEEALNNAQEKMSPSLASVLNLQLRCDQKLSKKKLKKFLPDFQLLGCDFEADSYLTRMLMSEELYKVVSFKVLREYFKGMLISNERAIKISENLRSYSNRKDGIYYVRCFLDVWIGQFPKNWEPYDMAYDFKALPEEIDSRKELVKKIISLMDHNCSKWNYYQAILEEESYGEF